MKKLILIMSFIFCLTTLAVIPNKNAYAVTQSSITRSQAEQRALQMINLTWTYTSGKNNTIDPKYASYVTQPKQLAGLATSQQTGIPYTWGGFDGLDTNSYNAPWTNFLDAVNAGAYTGNVNSQSGFGSIPGTAGLDCSGFVQAVFNIHDYKQSTSTLFDQYFVKINMSDLKHMDILNKPGFHVSIFDKWGTLNGISGAYTYEATPDQTFGGIQGTKRYFLTMNQINDGYIPGRYVNIVDDPDVTTTTPSPVTVPSTTPSPVIVPTTTPAPVVVPTTTPAPVVLQPAIPKGIFAQVINVTSYANLRQTPSTGSALVGTIPKGTILYLIDYSSGWYEVSFNGQTGWIYGNLIGKIPSGNYVTVNMNSSLNIRSLPSTSSQILGVLKPNQYALVVDYSDDGNWYKISINGITGWSYRYYLSYIY